MTRKFVILKTKWFLALQDGRESETEYDTKAEAEAALKARKPLARRGVYVASYTKQVLE